jgi:acyl carrier protein
MKNIELEVKQIVSEQLGVPIGKIENHHSFIQDLGGDSLDTVEMVLTLEDKFEIEVEEADAETMFTVQVAIDYITKRLQQTA